MKIHVFFMPKKNKKQNKIKNTHLTHAPPQYSFHQKSIITFVRLPSVLLCNSLQHPQQHFPSLHFAWVARLHRKALPPEVHSLLYHHLFQVLPAVLKEKQKYIQNLWSKWKDDSLKTCTNAWWSLFISWHGYFAVLTVWVTRFHTIFSLWPFYRVDVLAVLSICPQWFKTHFLEAKNSDSRHSRKKP